jgi:hypothetical protein
VLCYRVTDLGEPVARTDPDAKPLTLAIGFNGTLM